MGGQINVETLKGSNGSTMIQISSSPSDCLILEPTLVTVDSGAPGSST